MDETSFGPYRLHELLGRGGMGEVYRAFDTGTDRFVALKLLPPHLAEDPAYIERFRREAHVAAQLNDPHIIPIHRYGEIGGRLYLDMRLVSGMDLAELLSQGPLDPQRAVYLIRQVAEALDAAHTVGLVHRDIKPSNILVTPNDFVYLIDFGIARGVDQTSITATGNMIGTLAYMAPERLEHGEAGPPADIYALTCVLYESLTGTRPFPGNSLTQQITKHLTSPPPRPSEVRAGTPAALDLVIATGMAKAPTDRYASGAALARAAADALGAQPNPVPPVPSSASPESTDPTQQAARPDLDSTAHDKRTQGWQDHGRPPPGQPAHREPATARSAATQPAPGRSWGAPPPAPPPTRRPPRERERRSGPLMWAGIAVLAVVALVVGFIVWPRSSEPSSELGDSSPGSTSADAEESTDAASPGTASACPAPTSSPVESGLAPGDITDARITIGTKFDQPGLGLKYPDGSMGGFDVDVAAYIALQLGFGPEQIRWVEAPSAQREILIENNLVDFVVATYTITDARKEKVSFAGPYLVTGQRLLVCSNNTDITTKAELADKTLCSVIGSTPAQKIKDEFPAVQLAEYDTYSACVTALMTGAVDAVTTDESILAGFSAQYPGSFKLVGEVFSEERYGIGLLLGDTPLQTQINQALETMFSSGEWATAFARNFGPGGLPTPAPPTIEPI